ncbi:hypothetical protein [Nocardioides limicola]|uniref:hypothetical protein n=1 Tax=Nocardioides limicola TaxID=2803368 RepID=UPI00193B6EF6|nr:hypothetical protein [Nocardioides sp. DJM-14]
MRHIWFVVLRGCAALLGLGLVLTACGSGTTLEWQRQATPSGTFSVEFPGEPVPSSEEIPGTDLIAHLLMVEIGEDAYGIVELDLDEDTAFDLDGAVEGAIASAGDSLAEEAGVSSDQVTATETSRVTEEFEGSETRRYSAELRAGDRVAELTSIVFVRGRTVVQIMAIDTGDNAEVVKRFLDSLQLN